MHHWAHRGRLQCDPWWENETEWHRQWKQLFPENWREKHHVAEDGEIHRADIKTAKGIYIEVQHSPISDAERASREAFYRNLVWVIDGRSFRNNFAINDPLPDPFSELAQDLVWRPGLFFRLSENPGFTKATLKGGWLQGFHKIEEEVLQTYCGHHQYTWKKPRKTWLDAQCPVYIDFALDHLARLEIYDESNLPCVRLVSKGDFLRQVFNADSIHDIAPRTPPIPVLLPPLPFSPLP